jgi:hypothetical protein
MEKDMDKKINIPKKGAAKRLAQKLKELGQRPPPEELVRKINQADKKKVAIPLRNSKDLDLE